MHTTTSTPDEDECRSCHQEAVTDDGFCPDHQYLSHEADEDEQRDMKEDR